MSIVRGHGVSGFIVSNVSVGFQSMDDLTVMETVAIDEDRVGVHGDGHVFGMMEGAGRAVHGREADVVAIASGGGVAFHADAI